MDENREFIEQLGSERREVLADSKMLIGGIAPSPSILMGNSSQWAVLGDDQFTACEATVKKLHAAAYKLDTDQRGRLIFTQVKLLTDELIRLPDSASDRVLQSIQIFWNAREKFKAYGQLFKRGVLLWGPAGSGKTSCVQFLIEDIIQRGGIVLLCQNPELTAQALIQLRRIEPERSIICVLEDLDELARRFGEALFLSLLDGENQIENVCHVATTNYPELLDARFVNRPSRFDEVIKIGMPSAEARMVYLRARMSMISEDELQRWVKDTAELSIAHLRELVVAVKCLDRSYEETLVRIKGMQRLPTSTDNRRTIGIH